MVIVEPTELTPAEAGAVTEQTLGLELKAIQLKIDAAQQAATAQNNQLRSDFKYWLIAAVVATQTLSHVQLPPVAGYVGGVLVIGFAILKTVAGRGLL